MLQEIVEIVREGDESGNGMILRFKLPSGIEVYGLPTENAYGGGWDLGPTWNYLVCDEKPFLVDTGRLGSGESLIEMMGVAGFSGKDLDFIMISHGHEDHDGGLSEMEALTGSKIRAHLTYDRLIRYYPEKAPPDRRKDYPALCWRCFMPESFIEERCLEYQETRSKVIIEPLRDDNQKLSDRIELHHVPGHSPDSLALVIGGEAILVGDTVLPDITPWPTQEGFFHPAKEILSPEYRRADEIFGLRAYIRSLKRLKEIGERHVDLLVLPAHRLFYKNQWNEISLEKRIDELIDHHVQRCSAILKIIQLTPKKAKEIAVEHFDESLLKGYGLLMAENEVISHLELLDASGDVSAVDDDKFVATGSMGFESMIQEL